MTNEPLALDIARLEAWAREHIAGFAGPVTAKKFDTGQSNPTYLVETPTRRYVMRRKPPGKLLKSAHMVEREFRALRGLEQAGFPSPRALALCEDESVLGSVFYLMSHVEGRIFWDPSLPGMSPAERGAIYDSMNGALAKLHSVDVGAVGLADYGKPGNYFARQLQRWGEQYRASETTVHPEMDRLIVWLGANVPADDGRIALVHGDWRIDNMIFAKTSADLLAVLDWELSTLGHPFADLAYQCMQWRLPNAGETGAPAISGDITRLVGKAERRAVDPAETAEIADVRQAPLHALIGEIGEGMAERRQFPVEHRQEARRVGGEDHVVDAPVSVHQRDPAVVRRRVGAEPVDQAIHVDDLARLAGAILLGPALQLPREIIAGFTVVGETRRGDVDRVQLRQRLVHGVIDRRALDRIGFRHRRVPEDAPLDMGHEIEDRADDGFVLAQGERTRRGKAASLERGECAKFALDHMRRFQQLARRLAA